VAVGPSLGGILTGLGGWRMVFSVNLPLALVGILLVFMWIPNDETKPSGFGKFVREIDFIGIALFTGSLLTGMLFLNDVPHSKWSLLVLFVVLGILVVFHSLRTNNPFIDIRMLVSNLPLTVTYLRYGTFCLMAYGMLYGFSQWLQSGPGLSSTKAGLITLPMSVLAAVSALVGGRLKTIRNPLILRNGGSRLCSRMHCPDYERNANAAPHSLGPPVWHSPGNLLERKSGGGLCAGTSRGTRNRRRAIAHFAVRGRDRGGKFAWVALRKAPNRSRYA